MRRRTSTSAAQGSAFCRDDGVAGGGEDGVRLFWNATRKSNCKVKRDGDDEEKGGQASDGKVGKKVEYKVEEKNGQEEGVSLLPIDSA